MEKIYSPYSQEVIAETEFKSVGEIERLFCLAASSRKVWESSPKSKRIEVVEQFNDYLLENKNEIGEKISQFMGRPIRFSSKEVETAVARSKEMISVYEKLDLIKKIDSQRLIHRLPLGNILIFGAWNYPVLTAINSIVPAILAGNTVSFRPSIQTFFMGSVFSEAFKLSGLPDGIFQVTAFSHEDTKIIVQSKNIHGLVYTGSSDGGRKIHSWAAGNFIPVTMELGGKDAAYIRADADVEHAAVNVADGAFFNSGQSCWESSEFLFTSLFSITCLISLSLRQENL